jgi:hypothetical protein
MGLTRKKRHLLKGGVLSPLQKFKAAFRRHEDMYKIGIDKPVATPHSGPEVQKFIDLWNDIPEAEKVGGIPIEGDSAIVPTINAYINEELSTGNKIIFYDTTYLPVLAAAAKRSLPNILKTLGMPQTPGTKQMDIIHVAFGDYEDLPISAKDLKEKYLKGILRKQKFNSTRPKINSKSPNASLIPPHSQSVFPAGRGSPDH